MPLCYRTNAPESRVHPNPSPKRNNGTVEDWKVYRPRILYRPVPNSAEMQSKVEYDDLCNLNVAIAPHEDHQMTVKAKTKKSTVKKPVKKAAANGDGYKGHRADSNKGRAHELFDKAGAAKASKEDIAKLVAKVEAMGIKATTARAWFGAWRRA
jgi:hypothetical protein